MQLKFYKKPFKVGNSHAVIIPNDYIEHKLINIDEELEFTVEAKE